MRDSLCRLSWSRSTRWGCGGADGTTSTTTTPGRSPTVDDDSTRSIALRPLSLCAPLPTWQSHAVHGHSHCRSWTTTSRARFPWMSSSWIWTGTPRMTGVASRSMSTSSLTLPMPWSTSTGKVHARIAPIPSVVVRHCRARVRCWHSCTALIPSSVIGLYITMNLHDNSGVNHW